MVQAFKENIDIPRHRVKSMLTLKLAESKEALQKLLILGLFMVNLHLDYLKPWNY